MKNIIVGFLTTFVLFGSFQASASTFTGNVYLGSHTKEEIDPFLRFNCVDPEYGVEYFRFCKQLADELGKSAEDFQEMLAYKGWMSVQINYQLKGSNHFEGKGYSTRPTNRGGIPEPIAR